LIGASDIPGACLINRNGQIEEPVVKVFKIRIGRGSIATITLVGVINQNPPASVSIIGIKGYVPLSVSAHAEEGASDHSGVLVQQVTGVPHVQVTLVVQFIVVHVVRLTVVRYAPGGDAI